MQPERIRQVNGETYQQPPALQAAITVDRQLLEQLVEGAPAGMAVLTGPDHRFVLANHTFELLAAGRPVVGGGYLEVFPDLAAHLPLIDSVYERSAETASAEVRLMIDRGYGPEECWWQFSWGPLYNSAGAIEGVRCCAVETTRRATEQRAEAEKEAFLSVAGHELKTPLTVLKGLTQIAQRRLASGRNIAKVQDNLALAEQQITRLETLIDQLLDIKRIQSQDLPRTIERCDLGDLVRAVALRVQEMTDQHTITLVGDEAELPIEADPHEIQQVLDNLLWNAVKFSPEGGTIAVTLEAGAESATIRVCDSGIGIPPEGRERVFEQFYRGPNASVQHFSGMGIGLYLSRQIAERHGGRLWLEETSSTGSIFALQLPLASP
jgi:signal transduction histidine kinase